MNDGYEYREQVEPRAGETVLAYLARRHPHSTVETWGARLAAGEVSLDGRVAAEGVALRSGQRLVWRRPPWEEPAVPLAFAVLFRDPHLLAVAKPRGLPTMPAGGFLTHTLLHLVQRTFPEAAAMHRLGRGTSGLVLFARTAEARRAVAKAWRRGAVVKRYRALVSGQPSRNAFDVDTAIGLVDHPRLGRVYAAVREGKPSLTHVRVLEARDGQALVEATIPTGRPHQIRIHLAAAGHPLVGDLLYVSGGLPAPSPALPGEAGYRLHAHMLELEHPLTRERLVLECAPPRALRSLDHSSAR
ncbi:MAG TPA: RluA family pseudouridine synthase [Vicinamibacteria bacterium]|nr:RluA family pseudouridine synthase [Vicinamibacteria bacterium]